MNQRIRKLSLLKAIGWSIAFMLLVVAVSSLPLSAWAWLMYGDVARGLKAMEQPSAWDVFGAGIALLTGSAVATWVVGVRVLGFTRDDLRLAPARIGVRGLGIGLGLGAATAGVALLAAVAVTDSGWSRDAGGVTDYMSQAAKTTLALIPAALAEEVLFRGVPLLLFVAVVGRGTALVLVAGIVFALFHLGNPGVTLLGIGNIALAGIFLGVMFFAPGGLWTAFGAHLGWNATLAALDAPVSGLPFTIPWLDYHAGEPAWLSGGPFGPEGGLLATLAITAALLLASRWTGKDPT